MRADEALRRALDALFARENVSANIGNIRSCEWASATFTGMRHVLPVRLSPAWAAQTLITGLGGQEFDLDGHILIDIAATETAIEGDALRLTLAALTIVAD